MRAYKRMSKSAWALLIASTLATGGMVSAGSPVFAQDTPDSSIVAPQTQERSVGQERGKGRAHMTPGQDGVTT